jgi:hypothetical protein
MPRAQVSTSPQIGYEFMLMGYPYRFFETEGIAALTMIISRYKVTIKDEPQFAGETFAEKRARVTANKAGVTVT